MSPRKLNERVMRVNSLRIENHSRKGITVAVVTIILLLISITLRIYNLDLPLSADIHSFRQTQTAITVQEWLFSGYSALRYQTPVLGPPWTAMMEFPVYQTTVYVFVRLFSFTNLDLACRIVSVFYFYISVIALNSFCKLFFDNIQRASILILYVFNPFCIFWSRAALVDFCSVSFALLYTVLLLKWLRSSPGKPLLFLASIFCGFLAYLAKSTTIIPFVILLAGLILQELLTQANFSEMYLRGFWAYLKKSYMKMLLLTVLCVLPPLIGIFWQNYADMTKEFIYQTQFLLTANLGDWYFGTMEQKLEISNWLVIISRIIKTILPGISAFFPAFALLVLKNKKIRPLIIFTSASLLITVFLLFNLYYVHSYYLIALLPLLCLIGGIGLSEVIKFLMTMVHKKLLFNAAIFTLAAAVGCFWFSQNTVNEMNFLNNRDQLSGGYNTTAPGLALKTCTTRDEFIIVTHQDWDPTTLYCAERKGFMARGNAGDILDPANFRMLKSNNFTTILTPGTDEIEAISNNWTYLYQQGCIHITGTDQTGLFTLTASNNSDLDEESIRVSIFPGRDAYYLNTEDISDYDTFTVSSKTRIEVTSIDLYTRR